MNESQEQDKSTMVEPERRLALFCIREEQILDLFRCGMNDCPMCLTVPILRNIPKDAVLLRVFHAPEYMAFTFLLSHESFEPHRPGECLPVIETSLESRIIYLKTEDKTEEPELIHHEEHEGV